jgi:hypothetical protein
MDDEQRAEYWLDQAANAQARHTARDLKARETYLRIAGTYERLARALEGDRRRPRFSPCTWCTRTSAGRC